jgi:hypothetical protein
MLRKEEIELADMRRIFVGKNVEAAEDLWLLADQEQGRFGTRTGATP